jgi:hypothetical protein
MKLYIDEPVYIKLGKLPENYKEVLEDLAIFHSVEEKKKALKIDVQKITLDEEAMTTAFNVIFSNCECSELEWVGTVGCFALRLVDDYHPMYCDQCGSDLNDCFSERCVHCMPF